MVPEKFFERIHQIAHLEKKVSKMLGLTGDAKKFGDQFAHIVLKEPYKSMTVEQIMNEALKKYTVER